MSKLDRENSVMAPSVVALIAAMLWLVCAAHATQNFTDVLYKSLLFIEVRGKDWLT